MYGFVWHNGGSTDAYFEHIECPKVAESSVSENENMEEEKETPQEEMPPEEEMPGEEIPAENEETPA